MLLLDNQDNPDCIKLIKYLIKHNHWSPFEMVNMCVQIDTTRSVASQILRHRSFSFESMSTTTSPVISEISSFDDLDLCENIGLVTTDYDDCIVEDMNNAMFNDFI